MIHGIYIKANAKKKWQLVSLAISPEDASKDYDLALEDLKKKGQDSAEVGIQIFDSSFYIPESLKELKHSKPLYN
jgi:hypothetical protein